MRKSKYSVLVVSSNKKILDYFDKLLPKGEFEKAIKANDAGEARRLLISQTVDLLIVNAPLKDEFGTQLAEDMCIGATAVLVLVPSDKYEAISYKMEEVGVLTIPTPNTKPAIESAIRMACSMNVRLAKMEKKNQNLREKMEDIRRVNRAKWLLIQNLNMSEDEAHYYIEKQAMDMRISRREMAENIINTYDYIE